MKYIIGGGLTGLIFAFYNPEYVVLSENIGGQVSNQILLGPRLLQKHKNTEILLNDLGIEKKIKIAKIGYYYDGKFHDNCPQNLRVDYYRKTRCIKDLNLSTIPNSIMSEGKTEIEYYDINFNTLLEKLTKNTKVIRHNVCHINSKKMFFTLHDEINKKHEYEYLVSTIPAPSFYVIYKPSIKKLAHYSKLTYLSKQFIVIDDVIIPDEFDYVYYPESFIPWHRITKFGNKSVVEYTGKFNREGSNMKRFWSNVVDYHYMEFGQIQEGTPVRVPCVTYLGRYAEWDHSIKIQDVIEKSIINAKFNLLFSYGYSLAIDYYCWENNSGKKITFDFVLNISLDNLKKILEGESID